MDKFLEVIGSLGVCLVFIIMMMLVGNSGGGDATLLMIIGLLPWAVPAMIGCVIIAAFGNMLGQLKAIREASEKQAEMFAEIMATRKKA